MDCDPGGRSGTAPEGAREGPASLFTVERRKPFTKDPVGAPLRGRSAHHCSEVVLCGEKPGIQQLRGARGTQEAHGSRRSRAAVGEAETAAVG
jgi:hypothetical protein